MEEVRTIAQRELRNNVAEVLRQVEAGAHLRVTVSGRPVADLVPIHRRRQFVSREVVDELRALPVDEDLWHGLYEARAHRIMCNVRPTETTRLRQAGPAPIEPLPLPLHPERSAS